MGEELERIMHAAVRLEDGRVFLGKCHSDCFRQMSNIGIKAPGAADAQGFVTSKGNFAMRKAAAVIAVDAGQVREGIVILFSEDLWSPQSDGQFQYDSIKGYY